MIPKIAHSNRKISEKETKQLDEMVNGSREEYSHFWKHILDEFETNMSIQHALLEEQFKAELSKIKFKGEITPEKVKRHGFKYIHHEGVGTYITKNGVRVTDVFFKPII